MCIGLSLNRLALAGESREDTNMEENGAQKTMHVAFELQSYDRLDVMRRG